MSQNTANLLYLVTIAAFILALRFLSSPRRARLGVQIGAAGMLWAVIVTLAKDEVVTGWWWMAAGMLIGSVIGVVGAKRVKMTAMPQMVALFNGVGGGAAALISLVEFHGVWAHSGDVGVERGIATVFSALIGSISFAGSMIAFGKLQELVSGRPITYPGQQIGNAILFAGAIVLGVLAMGTVEFWLLAAMIGAAALFGIVFVLPIGGADMPVVISLLNAFTGLAAAATGFVLHSNVLIVSGMLVGASGTLLTLLMGRAMNRSVANVLFGAFGKVVAAPEAAAAGGDGASVRSTTADDVAVMLAYARRVVFVPGYGLAVAQAQHDVRNLAQLLEGRGIDVRYAIHPVAGRMPGHMNVLLAEANVPYDELFEMDAINPEFPQTDVVVVVGANDVVNPAARNQPGSPIYGMPILDVDKAHNVVVIKRSMSPGFAGIDNPLFYDPKTVMLFDDAKAAIEKLAAAVKAV
ncbi:MAG TPA: NAD(P)(+) transhydrogenase (Re/Si-specific) subunit beta [Gaiellaceae bacterium]|nr:NAD(P)(+) transhydrogenase (Re/Si-specific) subunit beta [Gaiellaceae bacterium]